jgi:membrane protein
MAIIMHTTAPVIVGPLILAMALLHDFALDADQEWCWITPGSAVAVLGGSPPPWGLPSTSTASVPSMHPTAASAAVIVLLIWMYVTGLFVPIGGEINVEIEHAPAGGKTPGEKALPLGASQHGRGSMT